MCNCENCKYSGVAYKDGQPPKLYCFDDRSEVFFQVVDNREEQCKFYEAVPAVKPKVLNSDYF